MCTVLFSYKMTPGYRLIMAANRDEFLSRPTEPLAYWQDNSDILAGRDIEAGGTWLGLNRAGRLGVITNFREPRTGGSPPTSRGEIITQYLNKNLSTSDFLRTMEAGRKNYKGFNLLFGDNDKLYYLSNRLEGVKKLNPGFFGMSNHLLDTDWPKVKRGKELLMSVTQKTGFEIEDLFEVLGDRTRPLDEELPDTGIGREWEKLLSTIFITSPNYGTRSSAVITIRDNGFTEFRERTFSHGASGWKTEGERCFTLNA